MTRTLTSKVPGLGVVFLSFTILAILATLAAQTQVSDADQSSRTLAVARAQPGSDLIGSGSPLFGPVATYNPGGFQTSMVTVADVNSDGKPDLVVINCGSCYGPPSITHGGSVGVLLGIGTGTFQPAVTYRPGGITPLFVAVADVNGDGRLDLVVANRCGNNGCLSEALVAVLLGNGDGTFQDAVTHGSGGLFSSSVAVADVNGDGKPDLLVANNCSNSACDGSVGVLLGNGDATFQAAVTYLTGGANAFSVAVADVNGDGKVDMMVTTNAVVCAGATCQSAGAVGVLLGRGDGTFEPSITYGSGGRLLGGSVAVADLNSDGKPDLVVENSQCCNSGNGVVGILLGNGDGTFGTAATYKSGAGGWGTSAAVADVNGDGKPDLLVTDQCGNANCINEGLVGVLLGNGDGIFRPAVTYKTGGFLTNWVAVADVNSDSWPDLVVANQCADDSMTCAQTSVGVLLNNSFDKIRPTITLSATPPVLRPPTWKLVPVTLAGTITDAGSGVKEGSAEYAVKDEYGTVQPFGKIAIDAAGNYSITTMLRAGHRTNDLNGRRYTIRVSATDNVGNRGAKWATVTVPYD